MSLITRVCWGQPGECLASTYPSTVCPSLPLHVVQPLSLFFHFTYFPSYRCAQSLCPICPQEWRDIDFGSDKSLAACQWENTPLQVSGAKAPVWSQQMWMQTSGFSKHILPKLQAKSNAAFSLSLGGENKTMDPRCFPAEHLYNTFSSLPEECHMSR